MAMSTEEKIRHYQRSIDRSNGENDSVLDKSRLLHCIQVLSRLPVTVQHLQSTGIGRTVNALRKIEEGVGDAAKRLVAKWKDMVANTDTSNEEDEACVPDVPECYESPDCNSEEDDSERKRNDRIKNCQPEALRRPTLSPPLQLNIDSSTPESPARTSDNDTILDDEEKSLNTTSDDLKDKYKSSSSSHNSKSSSKHSSAKDKNVFRKEASSKSSSKDKHKDRHESSKVSKSKSSEINEIKSKEKSKSRSESSLSFPLNKERKYIENGKRKYESSSSDGEGSTKKRKLSESTEEEDLESNNFAIENQSSKEEEYSKDKKSSLKDEIHCDTMKTKNKNQHHSSSSKSKSRESSDKSKKDKKHSSFKSDKRETEFKHKSDEHCSKESKSKNTQSSSNSKDRFKDKDKSKDKVDKYKTESSIKSQKDEKEKTNKIDTKDGQGKSKESKDRKERKELRESKEKVEPKDFKVHAKNKEHNEQKEHKDCKEKKRKHNVVDDGIDCNSGTSFADALGMCTMPLPVKKKKESSSSTNAPKASKVDSNLQSNSTSRTPLKSKSDSSSSPEALSLLSPNVKLEPLNQIEDEVDLAVTLPEPSLNYKPLPCKKNPAQLKREEDLMLAQVMYAKNQRTKVFSGNKSSGLTKVPSLYDICVRILTENIDAIEHTGGVPFYILKPIIEQATPDQLFMLEHHNPYLIESTDYLWQFHSQKDFRTKQREEMETWREMYMRCFDERETKLKALKANIKQSIDNSTPVRTTKLAYVDNIVKPPRNVLRKQAKFGTADVASKTDLKRKLITGSAGNSGSSGSISSTTERICVPPPPPARMRHSSSHAVKKTKAPLMAKALQAIKGRYKR